MLPLGSSTGTTKKSACSKGQAWRLNKWACNSVYIDVICLCVLSTMWSGMYASVILSPLLGKLTVCRSSRVSKFQARLNCDSMSTTLRPSVYYPIISLVINIRYILVHFVAI